MVPHERHNQFGMRYMEHSIAILYDVAAPFHKGGGEFRMYEVARRLVQRGWRVHWYSWKEWDGEEASADGIEYFSLGELPDLYSGSGRRTPEEALAYAYATFKGVDIARYDIVWCGQWPILHALGAVLRGHRNIVAELWEIWPFSTWLRYSKVVGVFGWILQSLLLLAARHGALSLVTISNLGYEMAGKAGIPDRNMALIHNGVDVQMIRDLDPVDDGWDVVVVGRLVPHKGVDIIIEALARLFDKGMAVQTLVVGGGPEQQRLMRLVEARGLESVVEFTGRVEDKRDVYRMMKSARLYVSASQKEGGGSITLIEAYAAGLPVVAFVGKEAVDPALIPSPECGIGLTPDKWTPSSLAAAIEARLSSQPLEDGETTIENYVAQFDWNAIGQQYEALFGQRLESLVLDHDCND